MPLQNEKRKKLLEIALDEPFSADTDVKRRNLLFISCFSILLVVYGLKVSKTPWLEFEIPAGAPNILHGALSAALFYTFSVFSLYAIADLRRWFSIKELLTLNNYFEILNLGRTSAHYIEKKLKSESLEIEERKTLEKAYPEAIDFFNSLEIRFTSIESGYIKLTVIQAIRITLLDLAVPLGLGLYAMYRIGPALFPFLAVVFN